MHSNADFPSDGVSSESVRMPCKLRHHYHDDYFSETTYENPQKLPQNACSLPRPRQPDERD